MRARSIKPSIFKNEHLAKLAPEAFRTFTGLWCLADRKGRLEDRPDRIEAELFPFKFQKIDMDAILTELASGEEPFILRYEVNQKRYVQIINFEKHQYPHIKEQESIIPAPCKNRAKPILARLTPDSPFLTADSPIPVVAERRATSRPHVDFVKSFGKTYEAMTHQPFKADAKHYTIAARLLKDHGIEVLVSKAKILGRLCENRDSWFTKGGWSNYTLETLSSHWNSILEDVKPDPNKKFAEEVKKQEAENERLNRVING